MDETPNYASYTLAQLEEALELIDESAFPERAQELRTLIHERRNQAPVTAEGSGTVEKPTRRVAVNFYGNGKEYFSIWIVNLLLTIVTLGIYSAWATVRNNRYFYSNTEIDGHRFAYLATPKQILIGRIIGVALFAAFYFVNVLSPAAAAFAGLALFLITPILVCFALRFRMRMTAYRNVRFNFTKRYGDAYLAFVLYPLIGMLTLGFGYPWALKKIDEFIYSNVTYGNKRFKPSLQTGDYYVASIVAGIVAMGVFFVAMMVMVGVFAAGMEEGAEASANVVVMAITFLLYALTFVVSGSIYQAYIRNHVYNNTVIEDVAGFESKIKTMDLILLRLSNLALLIITAGFAMPWVKVRTLKFFADATEVKVQEGAEAVISDATQSDSAVGDEVSSVFDVDIAIG